ncbi:hypothetical protein Aduo_013298 [Ancylostoma duodenale]
MLGPLLLIAVSLTPLSLALSPLSLHLIFCNLPSAIIVLVRAHQLACLTYCNSSGPTSHLFDFYRYFTIQPTAGHFASTTNIATTASFRRLDQAAQVSLAVQTFTPAPTFHQSASALLANSGVTSPVAHSNISSFSPCSQANQLAFTSMAQSTHAAYNHSVPSNTCAPAYTGSHIPPQQPTPPYRAASSATYAHSPATFTHSVDTEVHNASTSQNPSSNPATSHVASPLLVGTFACCCPL